MGDSAVADARLPVFVDSEFSPTSPSLSGMTTGGELANGGSFEWIESDTIEIVLKLYRGWRGGCRRK